MLTAQDIQEFLLRGDFDGIILGIHKYKGGFIALRNFPPLDKRNKSRAGHASGETVEEAIRNLIELDETQISDKSATSTSKAKAKSSDPLDTLLG